MFSETVLATVDARPYFERVLSRALSDRLIDGARLAALKSEGAKAIVQLATYFGTPNLRPELEAARTRLVTLVSLALEAESGGNVDAAIALLRQKSLLALSKSGADRLRVVLKLPSDGALELAVVSSGEDEKSGLSRWTFDEPITYARYLAEKRRRETNQAMHELSYWLAAKFGLPRKELEELQVPCESIMNSVLLVLFVEKEPKGFFSADRFMQLHESARKRRKHDFALLDTWREALAPALRTVLDRACEHFLTDVLRIIKSHSAADICREQERFSGLFYFDTSNVEDLTHHDKARAKEWQRITGGKGDHTDVQCTVLLMVATGLDPTPVLRKQDATLIWQNTRATGFNEQAVSGFIDTLVPFEYQSDIRRLWAEDLGPEAGVQLDDADAARALSYLHETCRPGWKQKKT
ncbi:MAG: hypothetical protein CVU28_00565 [Betaproteobacteria bacterium HGW-Betaproteobacteria-21]|nr:MAG: hypothetical protein CVU28_00565 [Betaproteobacteria bacterium HGW-Betaproteobacteria-21]